MIPLRSGAGVVVLAVVLTWHLWAIPAASPAMPAVSVSSADGVVFLSVRAQAAPLQALLFETARLAGFQVDRRVRTERTVSVEFKGLPLDLALKRLLSAEDFIFVYDPRGEGNSAKLRWLILLGPASSLQGGTIQEATQPAPKDIRAFDPDAPLEQLLPLTDHPDPKIRRAALEALTLHEGDDQARWKLMDQIRDPDPNIRSAVVGLLGPFVTQWAGAEGVVMMALRDPSASVRRLALQTLWEASSPMLSDALQIALLDTDPSIRARSEELLHRAPVEGSGEPSRPETFSSK
jgi:HEAT repeats/HEAT repeat associated with sister chromatid cohesion